MRFPAAKPFAEPGPDVAHSQERETKAKRIRPPGLNDQRTPLSRGPSGLPRSGKSGEKCGSTSVETTGHLSVLPLDANCRLRLSRPRFCNALTAPIRLPTIAAVSSRLKSAITRNAITDR